MGLWVSGSVKKTDFFIHRFVQEYRFYTELLTGRDSARLLALAAKKAHLSHHQPLSTLKDSKNLIEV